ncbi:MAG: phage integrase family protein [Paenibacillaceae bacterium]|nr:phage integrase family protein [Paenibacillaceae bacterium]
MRKRNSGDLKFLTPQEKTELFKAISTDTSRLANRNKAIFYLSEYCALRASEIGLLTLSDFDIAKKSIFCRRLKGSKNNTLKIVNSRVYEALERHYWERIQINSSDNHLFLSQLGKPISRKTLDVLMKSYCSCTQIPNEKHHFHVLKHTRAMELIEYNDVKLTDVQWWLGHRNIQNTMIYLDYTSNAMISLFNKIEIMEGGELYG